MVKGIDQVEKIVEPEVVLAEERIAGARRHRAFTVETRRLGDDLAELAPGIRISRRAG